MKGKDIALLAGLAVVGIFGAKFLGERLQVGGVADAGGGFFPFIPESGITGITETGMSIGDISQPFLPGRAYQTLGQRFPAFTSPGAEEAYIKAQMAKVGIIRYTGLGEPIFTEAAKEKALAMQAELAGLYEQGYITPHTVGAAVYGIAGAGMGTSPATDAAPAPAQGEYQAPAAEAAPFAGFTYFEGF